MGKQYIAIATICWEGAALWTTLIGTSISSSKAFELMHGFDYKKIIAEEFNIAPSEQESTAALLFLRIFCKFYNELLA